MRPYELQKHGGHTHILEARAAPGGRVATTDYGNGLLAEYGIQEIWANNPLIKIAEELGVDLVSEFEHRAHSTFMHDGKSYPDIYDGTMRAHWDSFLSPAERQALEDWLASAEPLHPRGGRPRPG